MARPTTRAALSLSDEDRSMLSELAGSRTAVQREVERAKVLLAYAQGKLPTEIGRTLGVGKQHLGALDFALRCRARTCQFAQH